MALRMLRSVTMTTGGAVPGSSLSGTVLGCPDWVGVELRSVPFPNAKIAFSVLEREHHIVSTWDCHPFTHQILY